MYRETSFNRLIQWYLGVPQLRYKIDVSEEAPSAIAPSNPELSTRDPDMFHDPLL